MEQIYLNKMKEVGFTQLICDVFINWENVKDEILLAERKNGTGNGTVHVFLGAADKKLREEFPNYYNAVENGEAPEVQAIKITHYFLISNIISMTGYVGHYYYKNKEDFSTPISLILSNLNKYTDDNGLISTTSLLKLSTGSNKLRPYFKQFESDGAFAKVIRQLLLPNSSYKISLFKNDEGDYAAFWLIGFDWQNNFEADTSIRHLVNKCLEDDNSNTSLQQIFYGAPGTGKSHEINEKTKKQSVIRTTFHPDTDYSTFVGAYKPTTIEEPVMTVIGTKLVPVENAKPEKKIIYEFVSQAFLQAYVGAWRKYAEAEQEEPKKQFLIIEEINRGNCAQIFGDLFQLLDRNSAGFSDYPITADADMKKQLQHLFESCDIEEREKINALYEGQGDVVGKVLNGDILLLPNNMYIWATMNTSDQSLFPIDSAFKRRWDWKYIPIKPHNENYIIEIDKTQYDWWGFLEKINYVIGKTTSSEDKKLGYFFVKANNNTIDADKFVSKVLFYIWNDVFKNYEFDHEIFNKGEDKKFSFSDFFEQDGKPNVNEVKEFLKNLDETIDKENSFVIPNNQEKKEKKII